MIHPLTFPFHPQKFYGPTPMHLLAYNSMFVQLYLAMQQPNPNYIL